MPEQPQIAPYGSWKSPISAKDLFSTFTGIGALQYDQGSVYWEENLPDGRTVIVQRMPDGTSAYLTPPAFNVRSRVHEYGGGAFLAAEGVLYFSNFADQRLYRQFPGAEPQALSQTAGLRYADYIMDVKRKRLITVREDHTTGAAQAVNTLAAIDLQQPQHETVLAAGYDFYSNPRLSPDGRFLAWLSWNHPNMPWDGTELWVSEIGADGGLAAPQRVAGGVNESIFQPEWSPAGILYFISDRSGWWNLYRWREGAVEALLPMEAEFGEPQWGFGGTTYGFTPAGELICTYSERGSYSMGRLDTGSLIFNRLDLPYSVLGNLQVAGGQVFCIAGSAREISSLVRLDLATGEREILRQTRQVTLDPAYFSIGQPVEFPTEGGLTAHAFFYPPASRDFCGPADERPPLLVMSHGGPTGATLNIFRFGIQYWTTRGIAVLDVNYGGSTGYGRAYRERLKGQWGIVDVADCVNGARHMAAQGLVDGERLAITGGSAGGFTTLAALTFYDTFKAGASYYGISDLEALAKDTHKFESRYLDNLVGPYPERRDLYVERSPIHHTRRLACPMIILQGLDDPVVPPNQAQMMYEAVLQRELPVAYLTFPGEQHGFVKAENNQRALEAELYFYSKVFKFELGDRVEPVKIENL